MDNDRGPKRKKQALVHASAWTSGETGDGASFLARRVGTTGHEIVNPLGEVVAWTVDEPWATAIVALLNGADGRRPRLPRPMSHWANGSEDPPYGNESTASTGEDSELTARKAISHLAYNGLAIRWEIPGEPSEAVRNMVEPYLADPEMNETLADLATKFTMARLADDHLGLSGFVVDPDTPSP